MDKVAELSEALPSHANDIVHIEVCQNQKSVAWSTDIKKHVFEFLTKIPLKYGDTYTEFSGDDFLAANVEFISIFDVDGSSSTPIDKSKFQAAIHVFQLHTEGAASEEIDEDELSAASHWILPATEFQGMWESLVFDVEVKQQLLNYASTTLLFSDRAVDSNIISWNRVILLHGPPGTGKTSLCKALAQKLAIRLSDRFRYGQLIEINSHSLFSKWFSESGKLVQKMFQRIQELIDDPESLVFVLIDEVESLTAARTAAMKGAEPSDAIRVVNALLTQIDNIRRFPNVMILTTSNITGAIDLAFVDRADIKQYIGPPSLHAIFTIYHSCITELKKKQLIARANLPDLRTLKMMRFQENEANSISFRLLEVARKSIGLSGRTLRKLPFLAHALFLQSPGMVTQSQFISALSAAVDKQIDDRCKLSSEIKKQFDDTPFQNLPVDQNQTDKQVAQLIENSDFKTQNGFGH
ncbi:pachytene checkpoint protein 2 homolog isoform X1 [Hydra vulgaris]|uniref:pachytene checkpoint protein 2 homolog isoform X1 n=1 Tax=Hydra vulgaris TaxID=6087 RepID=UPI0006414305|nr:pachytene checkpoint protein 2 homolog [Hydra vulgaris]